MNDDTSELMEIDKINQIFNNFNSWTRIRKIKNIIIIRFEFYDYWYNSYWRLIWSLILESVKLIEMLVN